MSAKIAVLGLVIEEPGPPHRLTAKLRQRLASAGFVDSNVYSALTRLERDGLVHSLEDPSREPDEPASQADEQRRALAGAAPPRATPARAAPRRTPGAREDARVFAATPAGVRHFEAWLLGSSSAPPLRDELHLKVALCQPHNLPRLVELVRGQELVCLARVHDLKRSFERVAPPTPDRWAGLVLLHVRDAELTYWQARLTWLQGVRESLERMRAAAQNGAGDRSALSGAATGRTGASEPDTGRARAAPGARGRDPDPGVAARRANAALFGRHSGSAAGRYPGT
jgi:hypothetical protein